ncbi:HRDC-like protein [Pilobolus umbonatus]|nr:HRDC-like protein [Pilobolus umbonatus]
MHIKNIRSGLITNYEVLALLEEAQKSQKELELADDSLKYPENLRTVQFELTEYLRNSPCGTQTIEQVRSFMASISQFELTQGEKLQILNLRPKSVVEIYLAIEECEERFSEEQLDNMLNVILTTLPRDDDVEEDEEMEEEE